MVPGHLLFLYTIHLLQGGHTALTPTFITCYLSAALLQVRLTDENFDMFTFGVAIPSHAPLNINESIYDICLMRASDMLFTVDSTKKRYDVSDEHVKAA